MLITLEKSKFKKNALSCCEHFAVLQTLAQVCKSTIL